MTSSSGVAGHAFLSYVRQDVQAVDRLQQVLETAGIPVWRDTAELWPGEDWRAKIRRAITDDALAFVACFSQNSVGRATSYQNEELALAIDQLRQRRPDDPWLIPVRFDECQIPDLDISRGRTLASIQRADLFGNTYNESAKRLVGAIWRILGYNVEASAAPTADARSQAPVDVAITDPDATDLAFDPPVRSVVRVRVREPIADLTACYVTDQNLGGTTDLGHTPFRISTSMWRIRSDFQLRSVRDVIIGYTTITAGHKAQRFQWDGHDHTYDWSAPGADGSHLSALQQIKQAIRSGQVPESRILATGNAAKTPFARNLCYAGSPAAEAIRVFEEDQQYSTRENILAELGLDLHHDSRLRDIAGLLQKATAIAVPLEQGNLPPADRRSIEAAAGAVQQALVRAVKVERQGVSLPPALLPVSRDLIARITTVNPDLVSLRYDLARLRARMRDYDGALTEINEIAKSGALRALDLSFAGETLMNLGQISSANRVFEIVSRALSDTNTHTLVVTGPLSEEERFRERLRSDQFRTLWLPAYRGRHPQKLLADAKLLLPDAQALGGGILEALLHRLARVQCDLGLARRDRGLVEMGLRMNEAAKGVAPDEEKIFFYLLDYSARSSIGLPGAQRAWDALISQIDGRPDAVRAHGLLASGKRLRHEQPIAAIGPLEEALEIWAAHPYPAGACDAMVELGLTYHQLGTRSMERQALEYFGMAKLIGEKLSLGRQQKVRQYADLCALRLNLSDAHVLQLARDRLAEKPDLCVDHDLSREGLRELRTLVEAMRNISYESFSHV